MLNLNETQIDGLRRFAFCHCMAVEQNADLSKFCTFGTGGRCALVMYPYSIVSLDLLLKYLTDNEIDYVVLGRGSNVLISDSGYGGVVVRMDGHFAQLQCKKDCIIAQAGATTVSVANYAKLLGLAGAEFLASIPASVGGSVTMNAGCFGYETKDIVKTVYATKGNGIVGISGRDCRFSYRSSAFLTDDYTVGIVVYQLREANKEDIAQLTYTLATKKSLLQPIGARCAGSVFLRGEDYFPAELIERAGLKGFTLGGASVSGLHSGFIVNNGNATSKNIADLIRIVENVVRDKYGVVLQKEIKYIGDFED